MKMKSEQSEGNPTRWIHGGNQESQQSFAGSLVSSSMRQPVSTGEARNLRKAVRVVETC